MQNLNLLNNFGYLKKSILEIKKLEKRNKK